MFLRRPKALKVAILGCGPTGLFAAHAFASLGYGNITILSKKRRSEMFGAQYLHSPIPGLVGLNGVPLQYSLRGTVEQYARKVYDGKVGPDFVSPAKMSTDHMAYDIREAYYNAWNMYQDWIVDLQIQPSMMPEVMRNFDFVVSTIPARSLCADMVGSHHFKVQNVWAIGDAPERGVFCPITVLEKSVVCNGEDYPSWYRASHVFGYKTAEWPESNRPPIENIASIEKPISTNCDCWMGKRFMRAGRYGTWKKGVLSHEAYDEITERY